MLSSLAGVTAYIAVTQLNCTYVTVGVRNVGFKKTYKRDADPSQGELEADPRFKDDENFILERIAPAMLRD
jgi:hypothetical protein